MIIEIEKNKIKLMSVDELNVILLSVFPRSYIYNQHNIQLNNVVTEKIRNFILKLYDIVNSNIKREHLVLFHSRKMNYIDNEKHAQS